MKRHAVGCLKKPSLESTDHGAYELLKVLDQKFEDLKSIVLLSSSKGDVAVTNTTTYNNLTVVHNEQHIHINPVGCEDIAHLQRNTDTYRRFMQRCMSQGLEGVNTFITKKHFSPRNPANHNIRKRNKKDNLLEYFDGTKWQTSRCPPVLEKVVQRAGEDFDAYLANDPIIHLPDFTDTCFRFQRDVALPLYWDLVNLPADAQALSISTGMLQQRRRDLMRGIKEALYTGTRNMLPAVTIQ
jgi:hypothetical protein